MMKGFRLNTLMLLIVIAAMGIALVVQHRREAELQARLALSWPLFLKQHREESEMRLLVEAMQSKHREELARRGGAEAWQQEREDAESNRKLEALQQHFREEQAEQELAKANEADARRPPK